MKTDLILLGMTEHQVWIGKQEWGNPGQSFPSSEAGQGKRLELPGLNGRQQAYEKRGLAWPPSGSSPGLSAEVGVNESRIMR